MLYVRNFRANDKEWLKQEIFKFGKQRMEVAKYMMETRDWDFFFVVEMGVDRLHHGFWKFFDKEHRKYEPGNPFEDTGIDDPYEPPENPEVVCETDKETVEESVKKIINKLIEMGYIEPTDEDVYTEEEEEIIKKRLEDLGYI